ncbi:MAG: prepilin-type N-terminal cleavage/methylation domain-containing protein [Phycisphaerales bacterium]
MRTPRSKRAFSMVEMLVALTITATLLTATMAALDASYKSYQATTEGASTNVVARMVMHRVMSMIRTGTEFGPYPEDVLDPGQNPVVGSAIEFERSFNEETGARTIIRLERRTQEDPARGPFELWYIETVLADDEQSSRHEFPLLTGVRELVFTLEYGVGPRLHRATVDLTVSPNDFQEASFHAGMTAPAIRLVSTVQPRRLLDQ